MKTYVIHNNIIIINNINNYYCCNYNPTNIFLSQIYVLYYKQVIGVL